MRPSNYDLDAEILLIEITPDDYIEDSEFYLRASEAAQSQQDWEEALILYSKAMALTMYISISNINPKPLTS